jgi:hypothetical protein
MFFLMAAGRSLDLNSAVGSVKMSAADAVPVVDDQTREPEAPTVGSMWQSHVAKILGTWGRFCLGPPTPVVDNDFCGASNRNEKESARFVSSNLSVPTSRLTTTLRVTQIFGFAGVSPGLVAAGPAFICLKVRLSLFLA